MGERVGNAARAVKRARRGRVQICVATTTEGGGMTRPGAGRGYALLTAILAAAAFGLTKHC